MICSDTWHEYHECYLEIVIRIRRNLIQIMCFIGLVLTDVTGDISVDCWST